MRFIAPDRGAVDIAVFEVEPLRSFVLQHADFLQSPEWPSIDQLQQAAAQACVADGMSRPQFVEQEPVLLRDGLHYEQRIAEGCIATRTRNWHDLFNALIWLRYPRIKRALNARQVAEIAQVGPRQRSRVQCALTHFDEGGVIVLCSDPALLRHWDVHAWPALCHAEAAAWERSIAVRVFGHTLPEHALVPEKLLVGKALVLLTDEATMAALAAGSGDTLQQVDARLAELIACGELLNDPQELRPLPLCGLPGWQRGGSEAAFYHDAPCFRPVREGRIYPSPFTL